MNELINNRPTRCNTKQSIYYSESSLYMFRVSTTPIISSTQNCNYSLRYWSYASTSLQRGQASLSTLEGGSCIWPVPEAVVTVLCTADDGCGWHPKHVERNFSMMDCFVLHLVGQLLIQIGDAQNHKHKKKHKTSNILCFFVSRIFCVFLSDVAVQSLPKIIL